MNQIEKRLLACGAAIALALSGIVHAQDTEEPLPASASRPAESLVKTYSDFAGSEENAEALVSGLREGREISLRSGESGDTTTFTGATKPMGYGNINIALALAEKQLAAQGVTEPTPEQIRIALNGGSITTSGGTVEYAGILLLRSEGRGWGEIANSLGFKLGEVVRASHTDKAKPPERAQRSEKTERSARAERPGRVERAARPDRPERSGK